MSPNTQAAYASDLRNYLGFLHLKGENFLKVGHGLITDYLRSRRDDGLKTSSVYRELEAIRMFHRYLFVEGFAAEDPGAKTISPKILNRLPSTLSVRNVENLINSIPEKKEHEIRFKAMLELLYATGMRVSELVGLLENQIDLDAGFVRVIGKGRKERIIPMGKAARSALRKYIAARNKKFESRSSQSQAFFLTKFGKPMTRNEFWRQMKDFTKKSGLRMSVHPHLFRHSFASHLLAGGADLRSVQELLGHSSLSTTQIYTHLDTRQMKDAHRRFHPRG